MNPPITKQNTHYSDLDGIRGILAIAVMLMHYGLDRIVSLSTGGWIARSEWELSVDYFFFLSGFVLARSLICNRVSLLGYLKKRILRLAPIYSIALLAVILVGKSGSIFLVFANLAISQSLLGLPSLNFPSWSIPFELYLPLLGMPLVGYLAQQHTRCAIAASLVFGILGCGFAYLLAGGLDIRVGRAICGIFGGMTFYIAIRPKIRSEINSSISQLYIVSLIIIVILLSNKFPSLSLFFYPLIGLSVFVGANSKSLLSGYLFQAAGRWSYSIYLLHIPVLLWSEYLFGPSFVGGNPLFKLTLAAFTIALASMCYRFIEIPAMNFGKSGRERRQ